MRTRKASSERQISGSERISQYGPDGRRGAARRALYRDHDFFPRQPSASEAYFYGNFMCKALPGARRRVEALSAETRTGVFVSHIGEERAVALRIKAFLETALTPALPVFVSSDYVSIESGEEWYRGILEGLKKSLAIIAVLSPNLAAGWLFITQ